MDLEKQFSLASGIAFFCWILLILFPRARVTEWLVHRRAVPLLFAVAYLVLIIAGRDAFTHGGGFSSLQQVETLFTFPAALLAGWLHYLAFDLFVGSYISKDSLTLGIAPWKIAPALFLTFMLGPVGLLLYSVQRRVMQPSRTAQ